MGDLSAKIRLSVHNRVLNWLKAKWNQEESVSCLVIDWSVNSALASGRDDEIFLNLWHIK